MVKTGSCNANSQQQSAQIAVAEAVANAGFTASQVFAAALRFQKDVSPQKVRGTSHHATTEVIRAFSSIA